MAGTLKLIVRVTGPDTLHSIRYKGVYEALRQTAEDVYQRVMLHNYPTIGALFKAVVTSEAVDINTGAEDYDTFLEVRRYRVIERRAHNTALRHWMVPPVGMTFKMHFWRDDK